MQIAYLDTKTLSPEELRDLFLSVEWSSGHFPDKLAVAMQNSGAVFTARDGETLVGLVNALDNGVMTAYVHYLLVRPEYQGKGIGKELLRLITDQYKDYLRIVLIAYDGEVGFYEHCGFTADKGKTPLFVTSLWT